MTSDGAARRPYHWNCPQLALREWWAANATLESVGSLRCDDLGRRSAPSLPFELSATCTSRLAGRQSHWNPPCPQLALRGCSLRWTGWRELRPNTAALLLTRRCTAPPKSGRQR